MNAHVKTFGSPSGEPSTTRSMLQQMGEKLWTLPYAFTGVHCEGSGEGEAGYMEKKKGSDPKNGALVN